MSMLLTVQNAKLTESGIWIAPLEPREVRIIGDCEHVSGERSIIALTAFNYDESKKSLTFDPHDAITLQVGSGLNAIFIADIEDLDHAEEAALVDGEKKAPTATEFSPRGSGDRQFIAKLAQLLEHQRHTGTGLLAKIRKEFSGDLKPYQRNRFIETPDNFWTITIQPRVESFLLTLRGRPSIFEVPDGIELRPDQSGYSCFKVRDIGDIDGALALLRQAQRKR